jgi:sugar lactone lactonase YvrE
MTPFRRIPLSFAMLLVAVCPSFSQVQVYFTNEPKSNLQLLNTGTNKVTTLYSIGAEPDDLILNSAGQLIYSVPSNGTINLYDPTTNTNSVLMTGPKYVRDLCIEPGGQTMLVAVNSPGKILRYNFASGAYVTFAQKLGGAVDGISYDVYGNLYAVIAHNTIKQIDPKTGLVLNTLTLEPKVGINGGDGLTYDPYSGTLWTIHAGTTGKGLIQIFTLPQGGFSTQGFSLYLFTTQLKGSAPDGIKSDGKGNLYVGAINTIFEYNIATNTITHSWGVGGADGVALVPGTY